MDVLASYLATFHDGEIAQAPSFDPHQLADTDSKTARLQRILTSYAERLSDQERDLLARLSVFPRGISLEIIQSLIDAGRQVAGTLAGCGRLQVLKLLERLRGLGLVFRYEMNGVAAFTAHPFLRAFFEQLLGVNDAKDIHETVRAKLVAGLEQDPVWKPTDPRSLDRLEQLIGATFLAGQIRPAYHLYMNRLGFYNHLAHTLGENHRGVRIVSGFSRDGSVQRIAPQLTAEERHELLIDWGLYSKNLGDCVQAKAAFEKAANLRPDDPVTALSNLVHLHLLGGLFPAAL